jgi:hypothetical protein
MVNLAAYLPSWTISVTTCTFRDVAFWLRVPVTVHSLRLPVLEVGLEKNLGGGGADHEGKEQSSGAFIKMLPVCHRD